MTFTKASALSVLSLCSALLIGCAEDAPDPIDLALTHVTVIDAVNPVRRNQTVLIDDGRIVDIVDSNTAPETPATEQIDASGQYLIPGLWDFHVHFTFDKRFTDAMAGLFLYHGITNVRDTGGLLEDLLPVVETLRSAGSNAPRLITASTLRVAVMSCRGLALSSTASAIAPTLICPISFSNPKNSAGFTVAECRASRGVIPTSTYCSSSVCRL